ncbi:MAG: GYD domain-containing protein [Rhodospirillaceae bacterium]|nr:GYD domain-containing protein [Rhodospirillaceae bacterium]
MGKYMFHATYTGEGLVGLLNEGGSRRRAALTDTIEAMGGNVEGLYYAFGETDLYIICDLPDDATATAVSLNIANAGALNIKATVLVTPETVDEAVKKTVPYRPPGA